MFGRLISRATNFFFSASMMMQFPPRPRILMSHGDKVGG